MAMGPVSIASNSWLVDGLVDGRRCPAEAHGVVTT
jgi:hypothetical protein